MRGAVDPVTDTLVLADFASAARSYRCPVCRSRVALRAGSKYAAYFAHVSGQADPNCENYFAGSFQYSGLRRIGPPEAEDRDTSDTFDVYFDSTPSGLHLGLWFPTARRLGEWTGSIRLRAENTNRLFPMRLLSDGRLVTFPLGTGQWELNSEGEISDEYLSRLELGPGSLERGLNLFDATRSPGRRIGPSGRIPLGGAVWAVTRDSAFGFAAPERLVRCSEIGADGGWHVFSIELPSEASDSERKAIGNWLSRDIREARAKVWIERPYPLRIRSNGTTVLPPSSTVEFRSDRVVDFEITPADRSGVIRLDRGAKRTEWRPPGPGGWTLRADGLDSLQFEIAALSSERPRPITAVVPGGPPCDLFELTEVFSRLSCSGVRQIQVQLSWLTESIATLASISGCALPDVRVVDLTAAPGTEISFQNLGRAWWVPENPVSEHEPGQTLTDGRVALARWLAAYARRDGSGDVRFDEPGLLPSQPPFERLKSLTWDSRFSVHVRALAKSLGRTR